MKEQDEPTRPKKLRFLPQSMIDINSAAYIVSTATTFADRRKAIEDTSLVRYSWIHMLEVTGAAMIPEKVLKLFPALKTDASLVWFLLLSNTY